ncbi:hypothetical protein [Sorangium sp. So ce341]|uniref:hypothetical protein n=1 Tax=Sorangium sp. So ce341 TaxID=3133302 RepID=UPI003F63B9BA
MLPLLLPTGEVLVIEGTAAQVYSPATNSWASAPSTLLSHFASASVLLPRGHVLIVGPNKDAELYDPRWHGPGDNGCSAGAGGEGGAGGGESGAGGEGGAGGAAPGTGGAGGAGGTAPGAGGSGTATASSSAAGAGGDGGPGPTSTSSGPGAGEPTDAGCAVGPGAPGGGASVFYLAVAGAALRRRLRRSRAAIPR